MDIHEAIDIWLGEERQLANQLEGESFETSLGLMADWDSNYLKQVTGVGPDPVLPTAARLILNSRRFAKLMADIADDKWPGRRQAVIDLLSDDLSRWETLRQNGQRLGGDMLLHVPGKDPASLIVPLTFRINAMVLLLGERPDPQALPIVVRYSRTMGVDANTAIMAFAADTIMTSVPAQSADARKQDILNEYREWKKANVQVSEFTTYRTVELPSFRAPIRPYERASSMGVRAPAAARDDQPITIRLPQEYRIMRLSDKSKGPYYDPDRKMPISAKILDFASRLVETK